VIVLKEVDLVEFKGKTVEDAKEPRRQTVGTKGRVIEMNGGRNGFVITVYRHSLEKIGDGIERARLGTEGDDIVDDGILSEFKDFVKEIDCSKVDIFGKKRLDVTIQKVRKGRLSFSTLWILDASLKEALKVRKLFLKKGVHLQHT